MARVMPAEAVALHGRRILVVEDDFMIAEEMAEMLASLGADTIGPISFVGDAEIFVATEDRVDGALLDINLHGDRIWRVVDALLARNIPVVLTTGYALSAIPTAYADLPRCEKPVAVQEVARALARALGA